MITDIKRLNILQISNYDTIGGAAKVAYRLKEGLKKKGHRSRFLVGNKMSGDPDVKQIPTNKYLQFSLELLSDGIQLQYLTNISAFQIKNRKDFANADIVNLHNLHDDYFNPLALPGLTKTKPVVYTLHDMWSFTGHCAHSFDCEKWQTGCSDCPYLSINPALRWDTTKILWKIKKWIYERSDFVIVTPSRWLRDKVRKSMLSDKKVRLIYNGVDETIFHPMDKAKVRKKLGLPVDKTILAFSSPGGLTNIWKGQKYLLHISKNSEYNNIMFLNFGENLTNPNIDKQFINNREWVSIPYVYKEVEMAEYYAASDLFIFPSIAENCPLAVLESMACGTPVIAFNAGGVPELLDHMKTGYIAEYKNSDDLANGIRLFLSDAELREKAGILARKKIEANFTLDLKVNNYLKLYAHILDKHQ